MGIRYMSYLDIPVKRRREAAVNSRKKIREQMASPFLTKPQHDVLTHQLEAIDKWVEGTLHTDLPKQTPEKPKEVKKSEAPKEPPPVAKREPTHHAIDVVDAVDIHES